MVQPHARHQPQVRLQGPGNGLGNQGARVAAGVGPQVHIDHLDAGLLQRQQDGHGRETVRPTDAGLQLLHHTLQKNRAARAEHELLVAQVARAMQRGGVQWSVVAA